jgi:hypothetical protein
MKHIKIYRTLGVLIILSLLLMVLPVTPVYAQYSITPSPAAGGVGDLITVNGSFPDSISAYFVKIYFSSNNVAVGDLISTATTREYVCGQEVPTDTNLLADNVTLTFNVPVALNDGSVAQDVTSGTYYIYATVITTMESPIRAKATFTLSAPTIDISPASGYAGTTNVQVIGSNFPASTILQIKFDSTVIAITSGHTSTLSTGLFLSYINIPSTATVGAHTITATAGTTTASATFTVTASPSITLIPTTGSAGTSITVIGANFLSNKVLSIKFDSTVISISSGDVATSSGGGFTSTITIPATATVGTHTITATADTATASATFTVTGISATLNTPNPTSGPPGTSITISGTGFAASTALVFKFGTTTVTPTGSTQTGSDGSFSSAITVPSGTAAGTYTITVTAGATSGTATFTVTQSGTTTPPTSTLPLSIDQEDGDYVGGTISIGASGFLPNSAVTVTIDGTEIAEKDTDASGFVVITFKVPSIQYGEHTVIATDGTNIASANFSIESTPPSVPVPLSPAMGEAIDSPASFDWESVTDISAPVTYNLQIATSDTFAPESIVIDKTGITTSGYTLTEAEQLKLSAEVNYYWREKAVDAAFNESIWTGANEFTMIQPFEFTGWPLYLTISLGGLVLFLLGLWVGRRTAFYY